MLSIEEEIKIRLQKLAPKRLEIINDSHLHAGHASSPNSGQSHFTVIIESDQFEGLSRVAKQRHVLEAIGDLFERGLHALAIRA